jgi:hypothetical protein
VKESNFSTNQIEYDRDTTTWVPKGEMLTGVIEWENTGDRGTPLMVIDGVHVSWHEFAQTVLTHEGFRFKLEFIDPTTPLSQ